MIAASHLIAKPNLDCVAEAESLAKHFPETEFSSRDAAAALGRSCEWILVRRALLKLPPSKQELFRTGKVPLTRVRSVLKSPDPDALCRALMNRSHPRRPMPGVRQRSAADVRAMMDRLKELGIDGFPLQLLAWQTGAVSDEDIQFAIERRVTGEVNL